VSFPFLFVTGKLLTEFRAQDASPASVAVASPEPNHPA
jgi:hypothetical protein